MGEPIRAPRLPPRQPRSTVTTSSAPTLHPGLRRPLRQPVLDSLLRVGACTTDQAAALLVGAPDEDHITIADSWRMERAAWELERKGLLRARWVVTTARGLRAQEQDLYRVTPLGQEALARAHPRVRTVLEAVMAMAFEGGEGWAALPEIWRMAFPGWRTERRVRARLTEFVRRGHLAHRMSRPRGRSLLLTLTRQGRDEALRRYLSRGHAAPLPARPPRQDQAIHHIWTVRAAMREAAARTGRIVRLAGDTELRSDARRGRRSKKKMRHLPLPDGRLELRVNGSRADVPIEVLTVGYSDKMIRDKHKELPPMTVYYAASPRVVERTVALGLPRPVLL